MTRRTPLIVSATVVGTMLMAGCAATPEVQPKRSLRELYEIQTEVNKTADPYDLGTGAAPGRVNHDRAAERARPKE